MDVQLRTGNRGREGEGKKKKEKRKKGKKKKIEKVRFHVDRANRAIVSIRILPYFSFQSPLNEKLKTNFITNNFFPSLSNDKLPFQRGKLVRISSLPGLAGKERKEKERKGEEKYSKNHR